MKSTSDRSFVDPLTRPYRGYGGSERRRDDPHEIKDLRERMPDGSTSHNDAPTMADLEHVALVSMCDWGYFDRDRVDDKRSLRLNVGGGSSACVVSMLPKENNSRYLSVSSTITTCSRQTDDRATYVGAMRTLPFFERIGGPEELGLRCKIFDAIGSKLEVFTNAEGNVVAGELSWTPPLPDSTLRLSVRSMGPIGSVRVCWRPDLVCVFECDTGKISGSSIRFEVSRGSDAWRGSTESLVLPTSLVPEQLRGKPPTQRVCYPSPIKRMDLVQKRVEEALKRRNVTDRNKVEDHKIWVAGAIRKLTKSFENLRTGLEACFPQLPDMASPDQPPITLKKRKRTLTDITNTTTTTIILD